MKGKYFEELEVGMTFTHQPSRTVTEADNLFFTTLTMNPQPLHLDAEFAAGTPHGQILVNSIFTLGLVVGLSVGETTLGTTLGNLGFDKTLFPNPVFIGDTITATTRVVDKRESKSKQDRGIVTFEHQGINQRGDVVCSCTRGAMMLRMNSLAD
ncbi:MAG: MaoC family dehydratase [Pseudomonadaceae bacterium]|nr:MaoC family dehydratase [Pseudomonadaceae bacterium]